LTARGGTRYCQRDIGAPTDMWRPFLLIALTMLCSVAWAQKLELPISRMTFSGDQPETMRAARAEHERLSSLLDPENVRERTVIRGGFKTPSWRS
jgi:hypothetical protein